MIMFRGLAAIIEAYLIYWSLRLFHRPQVFRIQSRMGGPAGLWHFDLRRVGRHHRRMPSRPGRCAGQWFRRWS